MVKALLNLLLSLFGLLLIFLPLFFDPSREMMLSYFETSLSLLVGTSVLPSVSLLPFCQGPHRGMTCWRHIQAGWPGYRKNVGDRISLQQTMAVMRVDSVKPAFWRPVERAMLAILNKCTLKKKTKKKSSMGALFQLQPHAPDSHALLMSFNNTGSRRNSNLSNFKFPPVYKESSSTDQRCEKKKHVLEIQL